MKKKLTFTMENYLEAIYELAPDGQGVRLTDIAERLGVSKASANSAMTSLMEKGFLSFEPYKEIYLTRRGIQFARDTTEKHHTILEFFTTALELDPGTADADACAIEHVVSCDTINAMRRYLNKEECWCHNEETDFLIKHPETVGHTTRS